MPTKKKKQNLTPRSLADLAWKETEVQAWPRLFRLVEADGQFYAELSDELYLHSCRLLNGVSPIAGTHRFRSVLNAAKMATFGIRGGTPSVINDLFKWVSDAKSKAERRSRAHEAKEILCLAIDSVAGDLQKASHGSKITVPLAGHKLRVPLAFAAIEHARRLVEMHQRLPTKIEVQRSMEDTFPDLIHLSKSAWPKVWKEAGLVTLPMGEYGSGNVPLGSR